MAAIGLSPSNTPQLNASRMADSIWEACGRGEYAAAEIPKRPREVPETDEEVIELMLGNLPADAVRRKACWRWHDRVDAREYANASRLSGLLWCVELYVFAEDPEKEDRCRAVVAYVREQYRIDALNPPQVYQEHGGNPWKLVRCCRDYSVMSRNIREREMLRSPAARSPEVAGEDWGG